MSQASQSARSKNQARNYALFAGLVAEKSGAKVNIEGFGTIKNILDQGDDLISFEIDGEKTTGSFAISPNYLKTTKLGKKFTGADSLMEEESRVLDNPFFEKFAEKKMRFFQESQREKYAVGTTLDEVIVDLDDAEEVDLDQHDTDRDRFSQASAFTSFTPQLSKPTPSRSSEEKVGRGKIS
jgi:hypothetical protein